MAERESSQTFGMPSDDEWTSERSHRIIVIIRQLLDAAFADEELTIWCSDHFHSVYKEFGYRMSKSEKIQRLLDYAYEHGQLFNIIESVQNDNDYQFNHFKSQLGDQFYLYAEELYSSASRDPTPEHWKRAIEELEHTLKLDPSNQDIKRHLEEAKCRQRQAELLRQAEFYFRSAVATPTAQRWQRVIEQFNDALQLAPGNQDIERRLMEAKRQQQLAELLPQARSSFLEVAADPTPERWQRVIEMFDEILELDPDNAEAESRQRQAELLRQAEFYFRSAIATPTAQEWQRVIEQFNDALQLGSNQDIEQRLMEAKRQQQLAELLLQAKSSFLVAAADPTPERWQRVIDIFDQVLVLDPSNTDAKNSKRLGQLQYQAARNTKEATADPTPEHWQRVIDVLDEVLVLDPNNHDIKQRHAGAERQKLLAQYYTEAKQAEANKDWQQVISSCQNIISIVPRYRDTRCLLWKARFRSNPAHYIRIGVSGAIFVLLVSLFVVHELAPESPISNRPERLMPQSQPTRPLPTPTIDIDVLQFGRPGRKPIPVKSGATITVTTRIAVDISVEVPAHYTDLEVAWYTCRSGDEPKLEVKGYYHFTYLPTRIGKDCITAEIKKGDILLDKVEIFVVIQ